MNYENLEDAMAALYESQDKKNHPVKTMALQQIIADLEQLMEEVKGGDK